MDKRSSFHDSDSKKFLMTLTPFWLGLLTLARQIWLGHITGHMQEIVATWRVPMS